MGWAIAGVVAGTVAPAIRRTLWNRGLVIGKRLVNVFIDPIDDLFYVPECDAVVVWTKAEYGRGTTCNLYRYAGSGGFCWRVAPVGRGPNYDRYAQVALWDATKLLCLTCAFGLVVVDLERGTIISTPRW
jgi:hypothetical protein